MSGWYCKTCGGTGQVLLPASRVPQPCQTCGPAPSLPAEPTAVDEPWRDMATAPKDNTILELKVDYADGDHPLHDATIAPTIGFNSFDDSGEDEWKFAGWCWCHDHFVQGKGKVIAWRPSRLNVSDDDGLSAALAKSGIQP